MRVERAPGVGGSSALAAVRVAHDASQYAKASFSFATTAAFVFAVCSMSVSTRLPSFTGPQNSYWPSAMWAQSSPKDRIYGGGLEFQRSSGILSAERRM